VLDFILMLLLAVMALLGLWWLLNQRDLWTGWAGMAVVAPALLGGIVAGWWLYQTCPVAAWGLAALFVAGFACATGHEIRRNW
jgi:peptidoglycan/LPS O-acetylase OafA/YrhL